MNGTILIWYQPTLTSLDGFDSLALVEGDLLIGGPFYNLYAPNNVLTRVDALQQLRAVRGTLAIEGSRADQPARARRRPCDRRQPEDRHRPRSTGPARFGKHRRGRR